MDLRQHLHAAPLPLADAGEAELWYDFRDMLLKERIADSMLNSQRNSIRVLKVTRSVARRQGGGTGTERAGRQRGGSEARKKQSLGPMLVCASGCLCITLIVQWSYSTAAVQEQHSDEDPTDGGVAPALAREAGKVPGANQDADKGANGGWFPSSRQLKRGLSQGRSVSGDYPSRFNFLVMRRMSRDWKREKSSEAQDEAR